MDYKSLNFKTRICGKLKTLSFDVPFENGNVITNRFCPQDLLTGNSMANIPKLMVTAITPMTGESLDEFVSDCNQQTTAMKTFSTATDTKMDAHTLGLMTAVKNHLRLHGRLIFGDLLIYVDIFSYLLLADGFSEEEIKHIYPIITKTVVDTYHDLTICSLYDAQYLTTVLAPIKETPVYRILSALSKSSSTCH